MAPQVGIMFTNNQFYDSARNALYEQARVYRCDDLLHWGFQFIKNDPSPFPDWVETVKSLVIDYRDCDECRKPYIYMDGFVQGALPKMPKLETLRLDFCRYNNPNWSYRNPPGTRGAQGTTGTTRAVAAGSHSERLEARRWRQ
jgi:hypothetical protein